MKKILTEQEKFEIGTVCLYTGLGFLTILPLIMNNLLFMVEFSVYRYLGAFFLILSVIFYTLSNSHYLRNLLSIGIAFILFSLFQIFFGAKTSIYYIFSDIASLVMGFVLCSVYFYIHKRNNS